MMSDQLIIQDVGGSTTRDRRFADKALLVRSSYRAGRLYAEAAVEFAASVHNEAVQGVSLIHREILEGAPAPVGSVVSGAERAPSLSRPVGRPHSVTPRLEGPTPPTASRCVLSGDS